MSPDHVMRKQEEELRLWQKKLAKKPAKAREEVVKIIKEMRKYGIHTSYDLKRYESAMMQGVYCPFDFQKRRVPAFI